MNWKVNTVSEEIDPRGKSINEIMRWYYEDSFIVNRRYQRKLVWTLEEKRLFIDSIITKYPTPSIILSAYEAEGSEGTTKTMYEIIDGLQRLNAIVSFVSNEFGVIVEGTEYFYDMQFTPTALTKRIRGELHQREPIFDFNVCQDFSGFEMPIILTTQKGDRDKKIEQIFSRINSAGRKLSAHDLRQASSVGEFPDLVRRNAADSRGDHTFYDEVNLCDMPKISLRSEGLDYGINPGDTFWIRHDIIPFNNFRQSKDEEVIASILAILLMGDDFKVKFESLNSLYKPGTRNFEAVTKKIEELGKENIEKCAKFVFSEIDSIFNSVNSTFSRYLYVDKKSKAKDIGFIALFCVLYRLNCESYCISDYGLVAQSLRKHADSTFKILSADSSHAKRVQIMNLLYKLLKDVMELRLPRQRNEDDVLLERLLSLSVIESQMCEFKIGITFFENGKVNSREFKKICQTLVAMSNTKCKYQEEGYVIVGIANNLNSCRNWEKVYGEPAMRYGNHYVVGITKEATTYFREPDEYARHVGDLIKKESITESLKTYILSNMRVAEFHGKLLLLLPSMEQDEPCYYEGEFYIREDSKTILVGEKSMG